MELALLEFVPGGEWRSRWFCKAHPLPEQKLPSILMSRPRQALRKQDDVIADLQTQITALRSQTRPAVRGTSTSRQCLDKGRENRCQMLCISSEEGKVRMRTVWGELSCFDWSRV